MLLPLSIETANGLTETEQRCALNLHRLNALTPANNYRVVIFDVYVETSDERATRFVHLSPSRRSFCFRG